MSKVYSSIVEEQAYAKWQLQTQYKNKDDRFYVKILDECGTSPRISFPYMTLYDSPSVTGKHTTFRLRCNSMLKKFFGYIQDDFIKNVIDPFYNRRYNNHISLNIFEDCLQYVRSYGKQAYIHFRFYEALETFAMLDVASSYTFDVELKGVHVSQTRIQLDWKLLQVCVDKTEPLFKEMGSSDADAADATEEEDALLFEDDENDAYESMLMSLENDIASLKRGVEESQSKLNSLERLKGDLVENRSLSNTCAIYEKWVCVMEC